MIDKRTFQRFDARYPARLKDTRKDYGDDIILRNASAQGVRLKCRERQYLNDHLALEVELPDGRMPMVLKGRVVWVKKECENEWDIGMEFHHIDLFGLARIYKHIDFPVQK